MVAGSLALAGAGAFILWETSPIGALALAFGTTCGIANALLAMRGALRLLDHRSVGLFVGASVLRIGLFGIAPLAVVRYGPLWTLAAYFIGFFLPLALYIALTARAMRTPA